MSRVANPVTATFVGYLTKVSATKKESGPKIVLQIEVGDPSVVADLMPILEEAVRVRIESAQVRAEIPA